MCKYCEDKRENPDMPSNNYDFEVDIDSDGLNIYVAMGNNYEAQSGSAIIDINFCPMCGRKLNENN